MIRRYLMVVGAILAVLLVIALLTKPKPEKIRQGVEEALAAYEAAQTEAPASLRNISLPQRISRARDYVVAVSYEAELGDGKTFSCWGAFFVTVCTYPD